MDFSFSPEQQAVTKAARRIFDDFTRPERRTEVDAQDRRFDPELWRELANADLLGIAIPGEFGGSGQGFGELCVLLEEAGRSVAPVPLYPTLVLGATPIVKYGTDEQRRRILPDVVSGEVKLSAALAEPGQSDPTRPSTTATPDGARWRIDGEKTLVSWAPLSERIIIPAATGDASVGVFLVDPAGPGVEVRPVNTTSGEPHADLTLSGAVVEAGDVLGDPAAGGETVSCLHLNALVGLCALQLGVSQRALRLAAEYVTAREQFGRPIGSFQAVQQRMADAFIAVEAMRWTTWQAVWRIAEEMPATR
ncbi:MAG: acyl-CoA dehydrogenase family protein, partial [Mycobacterium sp.]